MLFSIENRENLENIQDLTSLLTQVEQVRLQDKLSKQNFHENSKKLFEPVFDTIKVTPKKLTKTLIESSNKNNKALEK